jgi:pimeloyl-ACP methyl ester carboxylesterase
MYPWVTSPISHKLFFSNELDLELANKYLERMQGESFRLFAVDLLKGMPNKRSMTPTLVAAAQLDSFFKVSSQQSTAKSIGADFAVVPRSGHDIMLDVTNLKAAHSIDNWLKSKKQQCSSK